MPSFLAPLYRRAAVALACTTLALAGCGGGAQIEPFQPTRMFSFGDEQSLLNTQGQRWGVNGLDATSNALDCKLNPVWVQTVAAAYGRVFAQCNPAAADGSVAAVTATMDAAEGAGVAELEAQVAARLASLDENTLTTVLVGTHDILSLAQGVVGGTAQATAAAAAEARARGERVAAVVRSLSDRGAKVVVVTPLAMELSPWAVSQGADVVAQVTQITERYAAGLRSQVGLLDGRQVAMLVGTDTMRLMALAPSSFGLAGTAAALNTPSCKATAVLPNCSANAAVATDLNDGATATTYLWADDRRVAPAVHAQLASRILNLTGNF